MVISRSRGSSGAGGENHGKQISLRALSHRAKERSTGHTPDNESRYDAWLYAPSAQDRHGYQGGKSTVVTVLPTSAGNFTAICDHYCGLGHGQMKLTVSVVN